MNTTTSILEDDEIPGNAGASLAEAVEAIRNTPDTITFDIETRPLPFDRIKHLMPEFTAPSNYKDEEKIAANIAEQKAKWIEKAALSPMTGQVCAFGTLIEGAVGICLDPEGENEAQMLSNFWSAVGHGTRLFGWNIKSFDLPFMIRRSWLLGVSIPTSIFYRGGARGFSFDNGVIDLMEVWNCGQRDFVGLNTAARFFGVGQKLGDGADFHKMLADTPAHAAAYLEQDVLLTARVAWKMGVLDEKELPPMAARDSWLGGAS